MKPVLQAGTLLAVALWTVALVTPNWHVKTFFLGLVYKAELKMNLFTYGWHCVSEPPSGGNPLSAFIRSFCGKPWMTDATLQGLAQQMCNIEEQSFGIFKAGCEKVSIVAYTSMAAMMLIGLSLLFCICGAVFMTMDPGGKPIIGLYMAAPIMQFITMAVYIGVTFDLSGFYDVDNFTDGVGDVVGGVGGALFGAGAGKIIGGVADVAGKAGVNDIDEAITFGYSFCIAMGGLVVNVVLAWCVYLYVDDIRDQENWAFAKDMGQDQGTFKQNQEGWDQNQQNQQQWGGDQQWAGQQPQQQWGAAPQQQWGAVPPPGQQWSTTTTQWTGAAPQPMGFGQPAW